MVQLYCNNTLLDLYENTGLQFKKKNPLFAFDELSSERTTQFKIPSTPTNDGVFALARIPAYKGTAMRKQFPATLVNGIIVTNGFLYIGEWDGKDYSVIFVGGLAYDIKAFGNADWGRLILPNDDIPWQDNYKDANASDIDMIDRVKYHTNIEQDWDYPHYLPSIDLGGLLAELNTQGVFKITGLQGGGVRLIRDEYYRIEKVAEKLINSLSTPTDLTLSTLNNSQLRVSEMTVAREQGQYPGDYDYISRSCFNIGDRNAQGLWIPAKITFPENTPQNLCICYAYQNAYGAYFVGFMGTRSFSKVGNDIVYSGAPLAGQTIEVAGDFILMDANGAIFYADNSLGFNYDHMDGIPTYDLDILIDYDWEYNEEVVYNPTWHSMLTDLKLADVLKAYAACKGLLLNVRADGSVSFVSTLASNFLEPRVMERKNVKRTFSDWMQNNVMQFVDGGAEEWEKITRAYSIENVNLESEKVILTLPYSEGGQYPPQTPPFDRDNPFVPIPDNDLIYVRLDDDGKLQAETLAVTMTEEYMQRTTLPIVNILQILCEKSTMLAIRARMSFADYFNIDGDTLFLVDGSQYTWTDANWQKDTAQLTLQRIL